MILYDTGLEEFAAAVRGQDKKNSYLWSGCNWESHIACVYGGYGACRQDIVYCGC